MPWRNSGCKGPSSLLPRPDPILYTSPLFSPVSFLQCSAVLTVSAGSFGCIVPVTRTGDYQPESTPYPLLLPRCLCLSHLSSSSLPLPISLYSLIIYSHPFSNYFSKVSIDMLSDNCLAYHSRPSKYSPPPK